MIFGDNEVNFLYEAPDERRRWNFRKHPEFPVGRASLRDESRPVREDTFYYRNTHLSRHHAVFAFRDGGFYVKDLGSTFGTVVNGYLLNSDDWVPLNTTGTLGFVISVSSYMIERTRNRYPSDSRLIPVNRRCNLGRLSFEFTYNVYEDEVVFIREAHHDDDWDHALEREYKKDMKREPTESEAEAEPEAEPEADPESVDTTPKLDREKIKAEFDAYFEPYEPTSEEELDTERIVLRGEQKLIEFNREVARALARSNELNTVAEESDLESDTKETVDLEDEGDYTPYKDDPVLGDCSGWDYTLEDLELTYPEEDSNANPSELCLRQETSSDSDYEEKDEEHDEDEDDEDAIEEEIQEEEPTVYNDESIGDDDPESPEHYLRLDIVVHDLTVGLFPSGTKNDEAKADVADEKDAVEEAETSGKDEAETVEIINVDIADLTPTDGNRKRTLSEMEEEEEDYDYVISEVERAAEQEAEEEAEEAEDDEEDYDSEDPNEYDEDDYYDEDDSDDVNEDVDEVDEVEVIVGHVEEDLNDVVEESDDVSSFDLIKESIDIPVNPEIPIDSEPDSAPPAKKRRIDTKKVALSVLKEAGKGCLYAVGTIVALGIYGSTREGSGLV